MCLRSVVLHSEPTRTLTSWPKLQIPTPIPLCAFFLPAKSINTAVIIITVDLSKPWSVVESCCTWLQRVTHALGEHYRALEKRGSPLPKQLKVSVCGNLAPEAWHDHAYT